MQSRKDLCLSDVVSRRTVCIHCCVGNVGVVTTTAARKVVGITAGVVERSERLDENRQLVAGVPLVGQVRAHALTKTITRMVIEPAWHPICCGI